MVLADGGVICIDEVRIYYDENIVIFFCISHLTLKFSLIKFFYFLLLMDCSP